MYLFTSKLDCRTQEQNKTNLAGWTVNKKSKASVSLSNKQTKTEQESNHDPCDNNDPVFHVILSQTLGGPQVHCRSKHLILLMSEYLCQISKTIIDNHCGRISPKIDLVCDSLKTIASSNRSLFAVWKPAVNHHKAHTTALSGFVDGSLNNI